ncbi:MAG: hypothetical protein ABSF23_02325 [Terracidiphilus sp.]
MAFGPWGMFAAGCPTLAASFFLRLGWGVLALLLVSTPRASAQYPGQIAKPDESAPELRAVAVLEWTGDEQNPKSSRLVPVCITNGQDLEDAGIYRPQPAPLALETNVEYQLLDNGNPVGLFDIDSAARQLGSWVGIGKRKPLPAPKPAQAAKINWEEDDAQSDVPVLHRKHRADSSGSGSGSSPASGSASSSGSNSASNTPLPDPDRPTLHKGGDASSSSSGDTASDPNAPPPDSDRPVLHKPADNSSAGAPPAAPPPRKGKKDEDDSYVSSVDVLTDPSRPRLIRGKSPGVEGDVLPSLVGLPVDMHQQVAVSDVKTRPVHVWNYAWANPDDQASMKAAMEDLAREALGIAEPSGPAPAPKAAPSRKPAKPAAPPPPPAPLLVEQFRVFELAYGSGATMVLSAHTAGVGEQEKFVTLIAQPDLYGGIAVLLKQVTDAAHLDSAPRMRLIDAVDALADNRGELLFELRGATQRQFALYRVLRGRTTRIFLSGAQSFAAPGGD